MFKPSIFSPANNDKCSENLTHFYEEAYDAYIEAGVPVSGKGLTDFTAKLDSFVQPVCNKVCKNKRGWCSLKEGGFVNMANKKLYFRATGKPGWSEWTAVFNYDLPEIEEANIQN